MNLTIDMIKDKVEFFEARTLKQLEQLINEKIDINQAILLEVHHVDYQCYKNEKGEKMFSAMVHFKRK